MENVTFHGLVYPKLTWGLITLCLTTIAPGYLGEGCHASYQPFDASTPSSVWSVKKLGVGLLVVMI